MLTKIHLVSYHLAFKYCSSIQGRELLWKQTVTTAPYLKEAALDEDVADELIQVHQTLVISDMMGEDRQHHGVLWRQERRQSGG